MSAERAKLSDKRSAWWDQRLENWALWKLDGSSVAGGSAYDGTWDDGAPRPPPPLVGAALDTNALVVKLEPASLQEALTARYVWSGPVDLRARDCGMSERHLRFLVYTAKAQLERLDGERRKPLTNPQPVSITA